MRLILLGSGVATGVPAWNDGEGLALRARVADSGIQRRTGVALAVSADGERYSIFEAPPSLPEQLTRTPALAPEPGTRTTPIDTIVLTHSDLDATIGLLPIRSGLSVRIVSPHPIRDALLNHSSPFQTLDSTWAGLPIDRAFPLDRSESLEARFFPLPGPDPDYLRELSPRVGRARVGVRIVDRVSGLRVVWAPRITRFDSATLAELRAADLRFVDGRFMADEDARRVRPDARVSGDLGHVPIDGKDGSRVWLSGMAGRSIYVGLESANPILDPRSSETAALETSGIEVGFDGMEIEA